MVDSLLSHGHEVRILDIRSPPTELTVDWKGVDFRGGDMLDSRNLEDAVRGCSYVFHYATTTIPKTSFADPELDNQNLVAALRLIRTCISAKVEKIVFSSSGGTVYGSRGLQPIPENALLQPGSPYAITKVAIEYQLAIAERESGLDYAVLRYGNPYGPRQSPAGNMGLVSVFFGLLRRGQTPTLYGDGTAVKDFLHVTDAASAAIAVLGSLEHKVFNVGSGKGTSIRQLLEMMAEVSGHPIRPRFAPSLPGDESAYVLDIRRIREAVGWFPRVDLREGLRRTWEWILTSRLAA